MRVVIAGSRSITKMAIVEKAIKDSGFKIESVISGCARGVDQLAIQWAEQNGIRVYRFPAQWDTWGKSAGYRRNTRMAEVCDAVIAIWDGKSRGTAHMIEEAKRLGKKVYVVIPKDITWI